MFSKAGGSLPLVFLVTDGAVEDEKEICDRMRRHPVEAGGLITPRICTFGIGEVLAIIYMLPPLSFTLNSI